MCATSILVRSTVGKLPAIAVNLDAKNLFSEQKRFAIGRQIRRVWQSRTTARFLPSGDQSAHLARFSGSLFARFPIEPAILTSRIYSARHNGYPQ